MADTATVTIGLPVYNGERHLSHAIESVLAQDFEDFELLISDNASTDGTWDICRFYAAKDGRIRLSRNSENIGLVSNFNLVFRETRVPYFMWMSHDDILDPGYLSSCLEYLRARPDYVLCCSANKTVSEEDGEELAFYDEVTGDVDAQDSTERFSQCLATLYPATGIFGLVRRDALLKTRLFDEKLHPHGQDYVLLLKLSLLGKFHRIHQPLRSYRVRTSHRIDLSDPNSPVNPETDPHWQPGKLPFASSIRCSLRMLGIAFSSRLSPRESAKLLLMICKDKIFLSLLYRDALVMLRMATRYSPAADRCVTRLNRYFLAALTRTVRIPMKMNPSLL